MRQLIHTLVGVIGVLSLVDKFGFVVHAFAPTKTQRHHYQQQTLDGRRTRWNLALQALPPQQQQPNNNKIIPHSKQTQQPDLVRSRLPHQLSNGRGTFLGFRNTKDAGVSPLKSSVEALMPDGGLSPCVIRVLGVGGGGCNAVRCIKKEACCFAFACVDKNRKSNDIVGLDATWSVSWNVALLSIATAFSCSPLCLDSCSFHSIHTYATMHTNA